MEKTEKPRKSAKQNRRIVQPELLDGKRGLGRKTSRKDGEWGGGHFPSVPFPFLPSHDQLRRPSCRYLQPVQRQINDATRDDAARCERLVSGTINKINCIGSVSLYRLIKPILLLVINSPTARRRARARALRHPDRPCARRACDRPAGPVAVRRTRPFEAPRGGRDAGRESIVCRGVAICLTPN